MDETTNSLIGGHPEVVRNGLGVLEADFWPARFRRSISGLLVRTKPLTRRRELDVADGYLKR